MQKNMRTEMVAKLSQRLFELNAATNLSEVSHIPPPRLHELSGNRSGQFSVDLCHPFRLIFIPIDNQDIFHEQGGIDRTRVTSIKIIEITNTH